MVSSFVTGQIISVFVLLFSVISAQFKEIKGILLGQFLSNFLVALSYLFLGGISGAWICIVAAVQAIVIYVQNKKEVAENI